MNALQERIAQERRTIERFEDYPGADDLVVRGMWADYAYRQDRAKALKWAACMVLCIGFYVVIWFFGRAI